MATVEEIKAGIGGLSLDELNTLLQDDRAAVKKMAQDEIDSREAASTPPSIEDYDPRKDPGPKRREDEEAEEADDTPLSAEEVPLEDSRKDETSLLATDIVRVDDEGEIVIVK